MHAEGWGVCNAAVGMVSLRVLRRISRGHAR